MVLTSSNVSHTRFSCFRISLFSYDLSRHAYSRTSANGRIQLDEKFFHSNRMKIWKRYQDGSPMVNGISVNMVMKEERNVIIRFDIVMMHRVRNLGIDEIKF